MSRTIFGDLVNGQTPTHVFPHFQRQIAHFNPIRCGRFFCRFHAGGGAESDPPGEFLGLVFGMTLESFDIIRIWKMNYFYANLIIIKSFLVNFI